MNISVEYKDKTGNISYHTHEMSRLAFAKHLAVAGQAYAPRPQKLIRTIAMFFHYSSYIQRRAFENDRFSEPPIYLSDPTEKGQFSNLAGKAIADFLSKRIDQSIFTVNYEAAMRIHNPPIPLIVNGKQVRRPDLLAYSANSRFAIEAKGFSGSCGNMNNHKNQSKTGGIKVDFTVASVAYDLYNQVKCNYHDPINDEMPFDEDLMRKLSQYYYSGLTEFLNEKYFNYREIEFQREKFFEIEFSDRQYENLFPREFPFLNPRYFDMLQYYRPRLILPINIREYAEYGITSDIKPFLFETNKEQSSNLYIDNDRIGLRIRE